MVTCWCGVEIRRVASVTGRESWGHAKLGYFGHRASPTLPVKRHRKARPADERAAVTP